MRNGLHFAKSAPFAAGCVPPSPSASARRGVFFVAAFFSSTTYLKTFYFSFFFQSLSPLALSAGNVPGRAACPSSFQRTLAVHEMAGTLRESALLLPHGPTYAGMGGTNNANITRASPCTHARIRLANIFPEASSSTRVPK